MAFANSNISDIVATTIERRSKKVADNFQKNNALLAYMEKSGNVKPFSGGTKVLQELSFAANGNAGFFSGYDPLPVAAQDVISAAEFDIKQAAVPVAISGLEQAMNSGKEQMLDLAEQRILVAEGSLRNIVSQSFYGDGTSWGGKSFVGLDKICPATATGSQSDTYGGISRGTWAFWRSYYTAAQTLSSTAISGAMNTAWANLVRGSDKPNLVLADSLMWGFLAANVQQYQRFTDPKSAELGFSQFKFMSADVVLDGGIGGYATSKTMYLLNTDYLHWKPISSHNFSVIGPKTRVPTNQDASITVLGVFGALVCSNCSLQGRILDD